MEQPLVSLTAAKPANIPAELRVTDAILRVIILPHSIAAAVAAVVVVVAVLTCVATSV